MRQIQHTAVIVAAIATFVASSVYYSRLLADNLWRGFDPAASVSGAPSPQKALLEVIRTILIAYAVATIASRFDRTWRDALTLAVVLWFGFSAMMWIGAIMWEGTSWQIACIHSGAWLIKIVSIIAILTAWPKRGPSIADSTG